MHVTVPALALAGIDDTPATLDGTIPLDPDTARQLVGAATSIYRILTNPETGAILSFGRNRYDVPPELKRLLRERDATCRFVGCTRPAHLCDLDHTQAWTDAGTTSLDNLTHLCRGHHRLKHNSTWQATHDPGATGTITWHSPTGHHYRTHPTNAITQSARVDDDTGDDTAPF